MSVFLWEKKQKHFHIHIILFIFSLFQLHNETYLVGPVFCFPSCNLLNIFLLTSANWTMDCSHFESRASPLHRFSINLVKDVYFFFYYIFLSITVIIFVQNTCTHILHLNNSIYLLLTKFYFQTFSVIVIHLLQISVV